MLADDLGGKQLSSNENEDQGPFPFWGHWGRPPKHSPALQLGHQPGRTDMHGLGAPGPGWADLPSVSPGGKEACALRFPGAMSRARPAGGEGVLGPWRLTESAPDGAHSSWSELQQPDIHACGCCQLFSFSWCCGQIRDPSLSRAFALS